jgi:hypothetical protein
VAISYGPPEMLSSRVLNGRDIEAVKSACSSELQRSSEAGWSGEAALSVSVANFRVFVETELDTNSGENSTCGIVFRVVGVFGNREYYRFSI